MVHGVRQDPRPLHDKGFQDACARKLVAYLSKNGYNRQVSLKMLQGPPKQECMAMMHFLLQRVDPNFKLGQKEKLEDEIPAMFKRLKYPFQMSKSSLQAPGSPHTWPHILAAMAWLVEELSYEERAGLGFSRDSGQAGSSEHLFEYISESYYHFLAGDDGACAQLDDRVKEDFNRRDEEARETIDRLSSENHSLKVQLEELKAASSPLQEAEEELANRETERASAEARLSELKESKQAEEKRARDKQREAKDKEAELASLEEGNRALRQRIEEQGVDAEGLQRMQQEQRRLERSLAELAESREACERECGEHEVESENRLSALERATEEYNGLARRLELAPEGARLARGLTFAVTLNTRATTPEELLGVDLNGSVKTALASLREEMSRRAREAQEGAEEAVARAEKREGDAAGRLEERDSLREAVEAESRRYKEERERVERSAESLSSQAKETEEAARKLREEAQASLSDATSRAHQAARRRDEFHTRAEKERGDAMQRLLARLDAAMSHKQRLQQSLASACQAASRCYAAVSDHSSAGATDAPEVDG